LELWLLLLLLLEEKVGVEGGEGWVGVVWEWRWRLWLALVLGVLVGELVESKRSVELVGAGGLGGWVAGGG